MILEDYKDIRPQAFHFFVKMDTQQVTCNDFINFLDVCLRHTSYQFLAIMLHGFHARGASMAQLEGEDILNIRSDGRWGEKNSAIESYLCLNLISMTPEQIFKEKPHYRRQWSNARLVYIAHMVVQMEGGCCPSPHFCPQHILPILHGTASTSATGLLPRFGGSIQDARSTQKQELGSLLVRDETSAGM